MQTYDAKIRRRRKICAKTPRTFSITTVAKIGKVAEGDSENPELLEDIYA